MQKQLKPVEKKERRSLQNKRPRKTRNLDHLLSSSSSLDLITFLK